MTDEQAREILVVVADDEIGLAKEWAESISTNQQVAARPLSSDDLVQSVKGLMLRQKRFRDDGNLRDGDPLPIEECEVLIVDFDLIDLEPFSNLTARKVAYLASNFTDIPLIGILNLDRNGDFDLTLRPRTDVRADIHLRSRHVGIPGLWSDHRNGYRPWSWPLISKEVELWESRRSEAESIQDQNILDWLSLDPDTIPESALDIFGPAPGELDHLTMSEWIRNAPCALEGRDLETFGRHYDSIDVAFRARIFTRAMRRWLDLQVLPAQYPLCDLPHAYLRLPGMFKGDAPEQIRYRITCLDLGHGDLLELLHNDVHEYIWERNNWLSRPSIHWSRLMDNAEKLQRLFDVEPDEDIADWVFLEDCSQFGELSAAHRFRADFDVADNVRFIKRLPNIQYFPAARLAE